MESETTGPKRRLGSPLTVVAVVAVLAAGGGGAYWASTYASGNGTGQSSGAPGGDSDSPEPLNLTGTIAGAGGQLAVGDGVDLPDGPKTAPVQRPEAVSRAAVEKLAKALGVPGAVKSDGDSWKAGNTKEAGGPLLQVNKSALGTWSYSLYGSRARSERAGAVSEQQALRTAAAVLKAIGLDGAKSRTDATKTAGALRVVIADPVVGGLPTHGWNTTVQVGPDGKVVSGYGQLSPLKASAPYPVVSAEQALKTLNKVGGDSGVGIGRCPTVRPKESKSPGDDTLPRSMPCVPGNAREPVTVRSAEFGLSAQYVDGDRALVPSWLFTVVRDGVRDTSVLPAQAVDPAYVRTSSSGGTSSPSGGGQSAGIHTVEIQSYAASGTTLTVRFWGGVCSTYSASADESGSKVTVRVTGVPKKPGRVCAMIAKQFAETVRLDKPLGDRTVIDASDGKTVKMGKTDRTAPQTR